MRYKIKHITTYSYAARVSHCYNKAHVVPRTTERQNCSRSHLSISPYPANTHRHTDYFGNTSYNFEIQKPHQKLVITAESEVEVTETSPDLNLDIGISYEDALTQIRLALTSGIIEAREFLLDSPMIKSSVELAQYARPSFTPNRSLKSAVNDLTSRIFNEFTYDPQSTTVATPLAEVLDKKRGVCQDFAHLQIGCLRSMGIPARYVSGYLETLPPAGKEKLVGADASHAWLAYFSPGEGWVEFDPTNNTIATHQHIVTAYGRDYYDVTPLKGVIYGGGEAPILSVSVDVARI